jgi:hypothetical protein
VTAAESPSTADASATVKTAAAATPATLLECFVFMPAMVNGGAHRDESRSETSAVQDLHSWRGRGRRNVTVMDDTSSHADTIDGDRVVERWNRLDDVTLLTQLAGRLV